MQQDNRSIVRRRLIGASLAVGSIAALTVAGQSVAAAQFRSSERGRNRSNFAFGRTDEQGLSADDASLPWRARDLIRIGADGIARENAAAMAAFFHPQFRFHGPGGAELDREQLWAYFAACRAAFDRFTVTRQALVSDDGDYMATRTRFAGIFSRPFTASPVGTLQPNERRFEYTVANIFRYAPDGRLAKEWVQYDVRGVLAQLQAR